MHVQKFQSVQRLHYVIVIVMHSEDLDTWEGNNKNLNDHISKCLARHIAPWYTNCKNSSQLFSSFSSMMYRVAWSTEKKCCFAKL